MFQSFAFDAAFSSFLVLMYLLFPIVKVTKGENLFIHDLNCDCRWHKWWKNHFINFNDFFLQKCRFLKKKDFNIFGHISGIIQLTETYNTSFWLSKRVILTFTSINCPRICQFCCRKENISPLFFNSDFIWAIVDFNGEKINLLLWLSH